MSMFLTLAEATPSAGTPNLQAIFSTTTYIIAGICFILPSALFVYGSADVQLNVTRTFAGSGFFLPCGNVFGVQYRLPAKNAPGPRALLFKVVCAHAGNTVVRA